MLNCNTLQGRLPTKETIAVMSDRELEERLTVAASAPGGRLWQLFGLLLKERKVRTVREGGQASILT